MHCNGMGWGAFNHTFHFIKAKIKGRNIDLSLFLLRQQGSHCDTSIKVIFTSKQASILGEKKIDGDGLTTVKQMRRMRKKS